MLTRRTALLAALATAALSRQAGAEAFPDAIPDQIVARGGKGIAAAWLAGKTTRYRHFVLGGQFEAATIMARTGDGRLLKFTLPDDSVFEDRALRLADLDGDGIDEIIAVRSYQDRGAALAVLALRDGALKIVAETPPTGRANTWRNPSAIADLNGDGRIDIAEVQMPHVLGRLRVWNLREGKLVEVATLDNVSNHAIGSAHLGLSAVGDFSGDGTRALAIPTLDRRTLRFLAFKGGAKEIARRPLPQPAARNFSIVSAGGKTSVRVPFADGTSIDVGL